MAEVKIVEEAELIAIRVPPGDNWELVIDQGTTIEGLVMALTMYMRKTKFKGSYRLEPLNGKLFAIKTFFLVKRIKMVTRLPKGYTPSEKEPFMNAKQKEFFRRKLLAWRNDIIQETKETLNNLQKEVVNFSDLADRASSETDRSLELRARDRQRKLISKIDEALSRIDDGSYGYCEETGENIGLKRLIARPIATLSIDSQERHERKEKVYRDD